MQDQKMAESSSSSARMIVPTLKKISCFNVIGFNRDTHNDKKPAGMRGSDGEVDDHPVEQPDVVEDEQPDKEAEAASAHHQHLCLLVILHGDLSAERKLAEDSADEEEGNDGEEGIDEEPGGELLLALPLDEGDHEGNQG